MLASASLFPVHCHQVRLTLSDHSLPSLSLTFPCPNFIIRIRITAFVRIGNLALRYKSVAAPKQNMCYLKVLDLEAVNSSTLSR